MTTTAPETRETLFSLSQEMAILDELLTESGGELTEEVSVALARIGAKLETKTDGLGWFIRTCEARRDGYKRTAADLTAKASVESNKIDRLKEYVKACMEQLGAKKLEGTVYAFAIQKNGGKPPIKLLEPYASDPDLLPRHLTRITVTPDLDRIREMEPAEFHEALPVGSHVRLR